MKITIITIGKPHEPHIAEAVRLYESRLQRLCKLGWIFLPPSGLGSSERARTAESAAIKGRLTADDTVILLDERGHHWSSPEFAEKLNYWQANNRGRLVFIIGGAYGVDDALRAQTTAVWSLSKLVFPHRLVRVLLVEQLYRAYAILNKLPYHHG
ncbi:MAG TPA: 23S rRNA (pseudouridine(1915)-N(3))-methyltransferase RlmH [Candidatus Saccharimonadales bacterium]